LLCLLDDLAHGAGIACMKAAGDTGRFDDFEDFGVVPDVIGSEAFPHVCVEIDLKSHLKWPFF
jgi:hypothetical protein